MQNYITYRRTHLAWFNSSQMDKGVGPLVSWNWLRWMKVFKIFKAARLLKTEVSLEK